MTLAMIPFRVSTELSTISETTNAGTGRHTGVNVVSVLCTKNRGRILDAEYALLYILSTLIPHAIK